LNLYLERGYLPEGLANYLALLGWSFGDDREFFTLAQMAERFDVARVQPNPARFDLKKCTSINGDWLRSLEPDDFAERIVPFLRAAGLVGDDLTERQAELIRAVVPLVQERIETLDQAPGMIGFLLVGPEAFVLEPDAAKAMVDPAAEALSAAFDALDGLSDWRTADIESALRESLVDGLGLKPRVAFGSVRVAVTGRRVSPPLFESMELLGRLESLRRVAAARDRAAGA
jgi:glutamyl-tRNA synthetase